jgi:hypothetical protein
MGLKRWATVVKWSGGRCLGWYLLRACRQGSEAYFCSRHGLLYWLPDVLAGSIDYDVVVALKVGS